MSHYWSSPTTKFKGLQIKELHSEALDGDCPQCVWLGRVGQRGCSALIRVAGGIIVCKICGVAFHTVGVQV